MKEDNNLSIDNETINVECNIKPEDTSNQESKSSRRSRNSKRGGRRAKTHSFKEPKNNKKDNNINSNAIDDNTKESILEEITEEDIQNLNIKIEANQNENDKKEKKKKGKKRKLSKEEKKARKYYIDKKGRKRLKLRYKILIAFLILLAILALIFAKYVIKNNGSVKDAVLSMASDIVGEQDPIFILVLGVSEDIKTPLTDTIILCGYNPKTQKAYMLSVPRDTYVGKNPQYANGYDKINAKFQTSAEKTVETVELITGVQIDYYVIVRNLKIEDIFECIGSIDFDVPIDMNYDDPTQDLHIHLKKGYQTLQPNQIEQLLRFRHNNNGTSYPASYGDNDYGRMKTQREFIKAVIEQTVSIQNVGKVKDLIAYAYTNVQTNMSGSKVLDYVPFGLQFSTSNLRSEQLPGQSAMINQLWFYQHSKSKTKKLVDELMIYLELDEKTLLSHYKYGKELVGVKPEDDFVSETKIEDYVIPNAVIKDPNTVVDQETCKHNYGIVSEKAATCDQGGTVVKRCALCDKEIVESSPALGHNYDKNGVCTRCGDKKQTDTNTDKNANTNTVTNTSNNTNSTTDNNKPKENTTNTSQTEPTVHKHSFAEKINETPATCTEPGSATYRCQCGETETKTINPLGHNFVNGKCTRCQVADPNHQPQENTENPGNSGNPDNPENPSNPNNPENPPNPETPENPPNPENPENPG